MPCTKLAIAFTYKKGFLGGGVFMISQKCNIRIMIALLLLYLSVILVGCGKKSNESVDSSAAKPSEAIAVTDTEAEATIAPTIVPTISSTIIPGSIPDGTAIEDLSKDIDNNGIDDNIQIISLKDGSETCMHVYLNKEPIFEYEDPQVRLMGVNAFEYLDLDGDGANEIFINAGTNANSRALVDILCLKQINGHWSQMDIPLNELGNNGFRFEVTRGKDEFEFIISSDIIEQEIHFDASQFFVDGSDNIDAIKYYRENNYKEGDEVGSSLGWGICEAKTGTYEGRDCIIATEGLEVPYGHGLGDINTYFAYNEQGKVEILNVEFLP